MPPISNPDRPVLVWLRQDLRLTDNPALAAAAATGRPVIPVYLLDDGAAGSWRIGGAGRWWLHGSLTSLGQDLENRGARLILRRGAAADVLDALIDETGAGAVYWNRCYEPFAIRRDKAIKERLGGQDLEVKSFNGSLLYEPWEIETKAGGWFKVYTRFWHACRDKGDPAPPAPPPDSLKAPGTWPASDALTDWRLLPASPDWSGGFRPLWHPGERGAERRLQAFLDGPVAAYAEDRNLPAVEATSGLSAHLHFGDIGPRQIWAETANKVGVGKAETFLKEVVWREFAYHVLYHFPDLPEHPMNSRFDAFPWEDDPALLRAWEKGETGYPLVDAGMRELWHTGTMHNRVRMITASFLVKHLMQPWQAGQAWFWDTLVDADLASNAFNWQWVAGCGADAAPYFRIFNPVLQGERFDPEGRYVRRWVPELSQVPKKYIHQPWEAPGLMLSEAGVTLGKTYPFPIVAHKAARDLALAAFKALKHR